MSLTFSSNFFANSFVGAYRNVNAPPHVQNQVYGFAVAQDGTCYTNSDWDEYGMFMGIYKDGLNIGSVKSPTIGFSPYSPSRACAVNGSFVYYTMNMTTGGVTTHYIGRSKLDGSFSGAGWPGQTIPAGYGIYLPILSVPQASPLNLGVYPNGMIFGICLGRGSFANELYVSMTNPDQVMVIDAVTGAILRTFPVTHPGAIACDMNGNLWIVQQPWVVGQTLENYAVGGGFSIVCYDRLGNLLNLSIPSDSAMRPRGLCIDGQGNLLVADDGPRQTVRAFAPTAIGMAEIPGYAPDKLALYPSGVGVDSSGNVYTASCLASQGSEITKFSAGWSRVWQLECRAFQDCGGIEPGTDGTVVYTAKDCYRMNADGSAPVHQHCTVDKHAYPSDIRLHPMAVQPSNGMAPLIRRVNGHLYGFVVGPFFRVAPYLADADVWVPGSVYHSMNPSVGGNIGSVIQPWVDTNGDLWDIDYGKNIFYRIPFALDANGVPFYDPATKISYGKVPEFTIPAVSDNIWRAVTRLQYDADDDTMIVTGFTAGAYQQPINGTRGSGDDISSCGPEAFCYVNWSDQSKRSLAWRIPIHWSSASIQASCINMTVAGPYVFLGEVATGPDGSPIDVYDKATGAYIDTIQPPRSIANIGWLDYLAALKAYERTDGSISIFVEDVFAEKIVHYIIPAPAPPPDTTPPVIQAPGAISVEAMGPTGAVATFLVTAEDNVDGSVPVVCTHSSGSLFPIGTTTVICTASDKAGNTSVATFTVTVHDTIAPICAFASPANGAHVGAHPTVTVKASDAVGVVSVSLTVNGVLTGTLTVAPYSWVISTKNGRNTLTATAKDAAGNTASSTITVCK